jgi:hypothetical protein
VPGRAIKALAVRQVRRRAVLVWLAWRV